MSVDVGELVRRLANRNAARTEADIQSDVRLLLLHGDLDLRDDNLHVGLETQAGGGKRIDVEAGNTVIEVLYLKPGGHFAFVMPNAALSRPHFSGFRQGAWNAPSESTMVAFEEPWDIHMVRPFVFPMPACVVFGRRALTNKGMGSEAIAWSGTLPNGNSSLAVAKPLLSTSTEKITRPTGRRSAYGARFRQGATIVPRGLMTVAIQPPGPLGVPRGQLRVQTLKSNQEKPPWRNLEPFSGIVEGQFVKRLYLGSTLLPFRCLEPLHTVIPWHDRRLLEANDSDLDNFPGLATWWRKVDGLWRKHNKGVVESINARIDFQRLLQNQFPQPKYRVIYNRSGTRLVAACVDDMDGIIDTKLYWGSVSSLDEAMYLCAIFNSRLMTELVNPVQGRGNFGPRDFYSLPFEFPITQFDKTSQLHRELADAGHRGRKAAESVTLAPGVGFQTARRRVVEALDEAAVSADTDALVRALLIE
jgi:hypothetical protein